MSSKEMTDAPVVGDKEVMQVAEGTKGTSEPDDKLETLKQIEFYLSDANLPYDKFMWTLHTKYSTHWIPIATLASFKRMEPYRHYGVPWIAEALRGSEELIEVDEKGENVKRKTDPQPPGIKQYENSVYAKGFPDERPGLQVEMEKFFAGYGPIVSVRMRREDDKKKKFKHSVFCEFQSKVLAEAFLTADPKPAFEGKELLTMSKDAYVTTKSQEKGFPKPDPLRVLAGNMRKGFNAFKIMDEEAKRTAAKGKGKSKSMVVDDQNKQTDGEEDERPRMTFEGKTYGIQENGTVEESEIEYPKGRVMRFVGAKKEDRLQFKQIKEALESSFERTPYITKDFSDEATGFAHFSKEVSDEDVKILQEKVPKVYENEITWSIAVEPYERRFWVQRINGIASKTLQESQGGAQSTRGGRGRSRGGRGGRGGNVGRGGKNAAGLGGRVGAKAAAPTATVVGGTKRKHDADTDTNAVPTVKKTKVNGDA